MFNNDKQKVHIHHCFSCFNFYSVTTRCGTTFKRADCCVEKKQASNELYYENYNLVLIKYFY